MSKYFCTIAKAIGKYINATKAMLPHPSHLGGGETIEETLPTPVLFMVIQKALKISHYYKFTTPRNPKDVYIHQEPNLCSTFCRCAFKKNHGNKNRSYMTRS